MQKDEFENQILRSSEPRIVLFAADWCGYCRRFLALVRDYEVKEDHSLASPSDQLALVNTDSGDGSLWDTFKINLVPTIVVFSEGKEIFRRNARPGTGLIQVDLESALDAAVSEMKRQKQFNSNGN